MCRRLLLIVTLSAWLLATGSPWDLMQTFAWGRMIATYSESMSLQQAVRKTFSGDAMCSVCQMVQRGRRQTEEGGKTIAPKSPDKVLFLVAPSAWVIAAMTPGVSSLVPKITAMISAEPCAPLLTPPRILA